MRIHANSKSLSQSDKSFLCQAGWPELTTLPYGQARQAFAKIYIDFPCVDQWLARGAEIFSLNRMTMDELKEVAA